MWRSVWRRLHQLESLTLLKPICTPYGLGHVACSLGPRLFELNIEGHSTLDATGVSLICSHCVRLRKLRLHECRLSLEEHEVAPLLSLNELEELDLGGNPISSNGVLALCLDRSGRPLKSLTLWGSFANDDCAMAAMELTHLSKLDLSWSRLSGQGASCIALGLAERLTELRLANCDLIRPTDCASFLPALAGGTRLGCLSLAGLELDNEDLEALSSLVTLRTLDLHGVRLASRTPWTFELDGEQITLQHSGFWLLKVAGHLTELIELDISRMRGPDDARETRDTFSRARPRSTLAYPRKSGSVSSRTQGICRYRSSLPTTLARLSGRASDVHQFFAQ